MESPANPPPDIQIEIHAFDASEILPAESFHRGAGIPLDHGVRLRYLGVERYMGGTPDLMMFAVELPIGIASGLISAALWRFLERIIDKRSATSIEIHVKKDGVDKQFELQASGNIPKDQIYDMFKRSW